MLLIRAFLKRDIWIIATPLNCGRSKYRVSHTICQESSSTVSIVALKDLEYKEASTSSSLVKQASFLDFELGFSLKNNEGTIHSVSVGQSTHAFEQFTAFGSIVALALISVAAAAPYNLPDGATPVPHDTHPGHPSAPPAPTGTPPKVPGPPPPHDGTHPLPPHVPPPRTGTPPKVPDGTVERRDTPAKAPPAPPAHKDTPPKKPNAPPLRTGHKPPHSPPPPKVPHGTVDRRDTPAKAPPVPPAHKDTPPKKIGRAHV